MFLLMGVQNKIKDCGRVPGAACPVCGAAGALHVTVKYMTPHIFFIPTFHFGKNYLAACAHCASLMQLDPEKGRAVQKGQPVEILPRDLRILQRRSQLRCASCGAHPPRGSAFCNRCGSPL